MKNFLLMSLAAMSFVAAGAQEQSLLLPNMASTKSVVMKKVEPQPMAVKRFANAVNKVAPKTITEVAAPAKAAAAKSIPSVYVEDFLFDENIHSCDSVTMKATYAQDEEGNIYNLQATFSLYGLVQDVYGYYDSEKGTLTIPGGQYCYESETYGKMYVASYVNNSDGTATFGDLTFTMEDGTWYLDQDGYAVAMTGDYDGQYYWVAEASSFIPQNAVGTHMTSIDSWEQFTEAAAYTDNTYSVDVYGLFTPVVGFGGSLSFDVDGTSLSMSTGQNVFPITYVIGKVDEVYGDYLYLGGCAIDETARTISRDATVKSISGSITDGSYLFEDYYTLQSATDADGAAYTVWNYGLVVTPCETPMFTPGSSDADGINGVTISENKQADNTVYNLAGQVVGKAYKGIVIKNGKKFIQK